MQAKALDKIDSSLRALTDEVKAIRVDLSAALRHASPTAGEARAGQGFGIWDGQKGVNAAAQDRDQLHLPPPMLIRKVIARRKLRGRYLGPDLFADPAWDMMLDLAAAEGENVRISVMSLCIASGVAPTTALRWIAQLVDRGLIARSEDSKDRRRTYVSLTNKSRTALARYFSDLRPDERVQW
jgi:hypothetical protein